MTLFKVSQMPSRTVMQHHDDKTDHVNVPNVIHHSALYDHGLNLLKSPNKTNRNIKGISAQKFSVFPPLHSSITCSATHPLKMINSNNHEQYYRKAAHSTNSNGQNSSAQPNNNDNQNSNKQDNNEDHEDHLNNDLNNNHHNNYNGNDDDNNGDKNKRYYGSNGRHDINIKKKKEEQVAEDEEDDEKDANEEEEKIMEVLHEEDEESDFMFGDRVTLDKDISEIFAELSLEKEFSDILSVDSKTASVTTTASSHATTATASSSTITIAAKSLNKKRKTKKRKKVKKNEKNNGASYNPNPLFRAQGNIQISKQFTAEIIPNEILENISNLYGFMDKCTALCLMEEMNENEDMLRIFNYGFHSAKSGEALYCVVERQDVAMNASRGYKWKMFTKLYTIEAIRSEFGIHKLPKSLYDTVLYKSYVFEQQRIISVISNTEALRNLINSTQWHRIDIFNKVNNKRRMHLFLTKPEFMKECRQFVMNRWNASNLDFKLIPILMFNNEFNEYWIEHIWIIRIDEEESLSIGISFKYQTEKNQVKVTGIHLDKNLLIDQHQLIVPNHNCHCFDLFESNINYLSIGNPDDSLNKIKYYKQQIEELTKCKEQLQEDNNKLSSLHNMNKRRNNNNNNNNSNNNNANAYRDVSSYVMHHFKPRVQTSTFQADYAAYTNSMSTLSRYHHINNHNHMQNANIY